MPGKQTLKKKTKEPAGETPAVVSATITVPNVGDVLKSSAAVLKEVKSKQAQEQQEDEEDFCIC